MTTLILCYLDNGSSVMEIFNSQTPIGQPTLSAELKITAIKQAVKNPNRANIFINNKYDFSLTIAQLADYKLKVGQIITPFEQKKYHKASQFGKLYQRTLEWVLARPRSVKETKDYLWKKQVEPADSEKIIETLIAKKYLNDLNFTQFYVENRFVKKGISFKRLRLELMKKGIDAEIVDEVLRQNERSDLSEIQKIIAKKQHKYQDEQKLIQYLVRQGFDFELARNSVREMDSQS